MIRSLYAPRPNPYYLLAPDYRRNSAGIRVMHMLCDVLNRSGYEAYIGANVLNPELMTPPLTNQVIALHKQQGLEPIVVYPEVTSGNPLGGDVVVRYLLNTPGFLAGGKNYGEDDIMFAFTKGLLLPGMPEEHVMFLQPIDLNVFTLPEDPARRIPGKICYYQGRAGSGIDKDSLPADAVEITGSYPDTWEGLVEIFQTSEFFYSSATTALSAEAALCGCIGVVIPGKGAPLNFSSEETGNYGVAWGTSPQEIERARQTLPLLRESLEKQEVAFWQALDLFIETTQNAASTSRKAKLERSVAKRLEARDQTARQLQADSAVAQGHVPNIGVVVLDLQGHNDLLARTLNSLAACAGGAVSTVPLIVSNVTPGRSGAHGLKPGDNCVEAINQIVRESACDWLVVVRAGEEFTAAGLLMTSLQLAQMGEYRAVYADEVVRVGHNSFEAALRPDFNLDLLLSYPAGFSRHWLLRRDTWQEMGGFADDCQEAFELQFILRLIESGGVEGLGHISEPLLISDAVPLQDMAEERRVIVQHLQQRGYEHAQVNASQPGRYQIDYGHAQTPRVSIVILLDGQLPQAQLCMDSLLENTTYSHFEVLLLDRGNQDSAMVDWLSGIEQLGVAQLQVLRYEAQASPIAIRNHACNQASGDYLLFLDSTIGVVGKDWLQQLLNHAMRPEVGCVGGKLLGGDGRIRHAGLLLGLGAAVGDPFLNAPDEPGYMQRLQVDQDCSAVAEQCLMVRRELFVAAGGFDETMSSWASTDLCLKLSQAGYMNVWTPRVRLFIGDTQASPASADQDDLMYQRWLAVLAQDPAYNKNLSLATGGAFKLADNAWALPLSIAGVSAPKILAHPARSAVDGQSRLIQPFTALRNEGLIDGAVVRDLMSVAELARFAPDSVVLQRHVDGMQIEAMRRMKAFSRAFKVYELDRYLPDTPMPGFNRENHGLQVLDALRQGLGFMDRLVVSSDMLADVFEGFNPDVQILKTRLDPHPWIGLSSKRQAGDKPRVGLSARGARPDDLELIADVIKALVNDVHWVLIGHCPTHLRAFVHEVYTDVDAGYAARLASLNLDFALAPLQNTLLNRCRSHERLLEFGALGIPVIGSDLEPHRGDLPVTLVKDGVAPWMDAIRSHMVDLDAAQRLGDTLQQCVRSQWLLDGLHLKAWRDIWLPA
ncbi:glycosyltransferase [Pseudomonas protegens]|uniref:glycosyltransferase n=1 Tax=Pseudomonas TaxID=286 RepID=UPI00159EBB40|nr:glycosyltransferase [Pseudomonas protegens]